MIEECKLVLGDCLEEMKEMPDNSVDLCLTDPPYGLEFMGKEWDKWTDSFTEQWASVLLPKLKDGAFLVFTMTPRQDLLWRCLAGLDKAGFVLSTSGMFWLYHTGFPKAMDVAKAIDKSEGVKGKIVGNTVNCNRKESPFKVEDGWNQNDLKPNERFIIKPESEDAKRWQGWKSFQPKPAVECIIVAQKPRTQKTICGQVLKNGCGAVNVEKCRIPYANKNDKTRGGFGTEKIGYEHQSQNLVGAKWIEGNEQGRFPANLLVSGEPLVGEETKSPNGKVVRQPRQGSVFTGENCGFKSENLTDSGYGDVGTANRFYSLDRWAEKRNITLCEDSAFFDVPKPSKAEKNEGCEEFEEKNKSSITSQNFENALTGSGNKRKITHKNNHPTCKPTTLFRYLATLFCQPNGTILDPFMGSGTTGIACLQENKRFIGIEKAEEYFKIAEARIKPYREQERLF